MKEIQLNSYQREAVLDDSNACLVNANVGSGKTTVLIEKIRYLHDEKQVPFSDMCVLTFTNKAAEEIRERLSARVFPESAEEEALFGTFHGVALKLLQEKLPVEELGYRADFQVMTPEEELEMALQLTMRHELKIKYKNRMKKRLDQEGRTDTGRVHYQDDWNQLLGLMEEEKRVLNKMTYRDLLQKATELLKKHPDRLMLQWIIIDELQDCDQMQVAFLEQLKKPQTKLFAVGDPNQVIYSWRGSVFQIFPLLRMKYQARELSLPMNYRSTGTILEAAKRFLQTGAQLEGCREQGQKIVIKNHYDSFQEADYLAGRIKELHSQGVSYGDIGIFYRLQNQSEILEKTFKRNEIPCQVSVKKSLQEIPVLHWFFYVLKSVAYPEDESSLLQVLCDKKYGEGWTSKRAAKELEKIKHGNNGKTENSLLYRIYSLKERGEVDILCVNTWSDFLLERLKIQEQILPTSASYQEDMAYVIQILDECDRVICKGQEEKRVSWEGWLSGVKEALNRISLSGMHLEEQPEGNTDQVKLMTLHASKGLEFSHVFLIGVNNGLIPLLSGGMESEEEERRLFFVGMTRAREYLEFSYYTSPDGVRVMPGPGRFLRFLPERLVDAPADFKGQPKNREHAQAHLQEIKRQMKEQHEPEIIQRKRQKVRHEKYGVGEIIEENDMQIMAEFGDYGRKEFVRGFIMLEYLDE